jgi:high-affinity iron transporter
LIVGIVAAFLQQEQRKDALRWMWLGVLLAVSLCVAAGVALRLASEQLPQKEQEQLETVIGLVAVGMITWMIVWMRRHAKDLRGDLERSASAALLEGGTFALVGMAFLAVLREGLETAVFLLAVFQDSDDPAATGTGAALGVLVAVVVGYLIYRGGVKINLARFFKITGVVLVLVAAGLLAMAVHTAHEAGWWNLLLDQFVDLSAVIKPGTIASALITGMFGIQPKPTVGEALAWVIYAVPMTFYVLSAPSAPKQKSVSSSASTPPVPSAV